MAARTWLALLLAVAATGCGISEPAVGYQGPLPSSASRTACLTPIQGVTFTDTTGVFGGGEWTVAGFAVGHDPLVQLMRGVDGEPGFQRKFVTVHTDGDVADLYRRVTGERRAAYEGELSDAYRRSLGL